MPEIYDITWLCLTICNNLFIFVKILFLKVIKLRKPNLRSVDYLVVLFWTSNVSRAICERHSLKTMSWCDKAFAKGVVTAWHCFQGMVGDLNRSGEPTCVAGVANWKKTLMQVALFSSNTRFKHSAVTLPSNRRIVYSASNLIVKRKVISLQALSPEATFRKAAWSCAIFVTKFAGSFVAEKTQLYVSWSKKNSTRLKKQRNFLRRHDGNINVWK